MNPKKILVFGGSGFLGSHVCDKLTDDGHEVTIFDLHDSSYLRPEQKMIKSDILDRNSVIDAVKGQDVVYNFAGYADMESASVDPVQTTNLNLIGNLYILEACIQHKVKHFIYASTMYVYSESGGFYRCSKQASEVYLDEYHRRYGLNYSILRYGTLYGPRADDRNSIFKYIRSALNDGKIEVNATGEEIREYIHVRDAAKVSARILESKFFNKRFVITGHQAVPVKQMLAMIEEILKKTIEIKYHSDHGFDHYKITPYSFVPKIGEKFAPDIFTDMGQGLIECMADYMESNGS